MKKCLLTIVSLCSLALNAGAQDDMYLGKKDMKAEVELPTVKVRDVDIDEYNRYFYNNYIPVATDSLGNDVIDWANVGTYPDSTDIVDTMKVRRRFIYIDNEWYNPYYRWYDTWGWRYSWYDPWYNPWYDPWYSPWYDTWWGSYRPWHPWRPYYPWYGPVIVRRYPVATRNHAGSLRPSNYDRNSYGNHNGSFNRSNRNRSNNNQTRNYNNTRSYQSSHHSGSFSGGGRSGSFSGGGRSGGFSGGGHSGGFSGGRRR